MIAWNVRALLAIGLLFVLGSPLLLATPLLAKNVTAQVVRETDLDEKIALACYKHCQGNRRAGQLRRVIVHRTGSRSFAVRADVSLINRHHQDPPRVFGRRVDGGFQVYSFTINVEAYGTLDSITCNLTIDRIEVINDQLGLSKLARREEGKVHRISNCRSFLSGL